MTGLEQKFPASLLNEVKLKAIERGFYGVDVIDDTNEHNTNGLNYAWVYVYNPTSSAVTATVSCASLVQVGTNTAYVGNVIIQPGKGKWLIPIYSIKLASGILHVHRTEQAKGASLDYLSGLFNF